MTAPAMTAPDAPAMTAKQQIANLTDARLKALAFRAWRATASKNERVRKKAVRLRPLLRAEIAARAARKPPAA